MSAESVDTEESSEGPGPEERARRVAEDLEGEDYNSREELEDDLNGDSDVSDEVFVELNNLNNLDAFEGEEGDVAVFMPHCLRHPDHCIAEKTENGFDCKSCMECEIGVVQEELDGVADVYMVPGGGMVRKILSREDYSTVVGVACFPELELGKKLTDSLGMPTQMVALEEAGCQDTSVDADAVVGKAEKGS